jgi:anti-sigma B factor antagonist
VAVAVLHGDYDLGNSAALHTELLDVLRSRPSGIVLDLSDVAFCDLTCLRTMASIGHRAAAMGAWVRVAGASTMVRRMLEVTGLSASLPAFPDVELALRGSRIRPMLPGGRAVSAPAVSDSGVTARLNSFSAAPTPTEV